ncbi:tetratricopeptide tpr-2 repeat-containing protein [Leptolyngbya sp. Heron Island J]|nr:tetratricopeptide tpr-2 repeat-containing protein [Leptolyngbya sp. Heron Island J]
MDINVYLALEKKNARQAQKLKTLQKYVQKYRSGWKKRLELADLLYETGQWPQAIVEYNQVIQKQPQLLKPRMQLGKILQLTNRMEEAVEVYRGAIACAKQEATRQHLIGLLASCQGNSRDAIAALRSATTLEPQNLTHWLALGKLQMEMEYPVAALSSFDTLLSLEPNDLMGLVYSHDLLLTLGNLPEAENYLNRAMEIAPEDVQILKRVIINRCRKRLVFDAAGKQTKKLISALLKQAPSLPSAHNLSAQYYIARNELQRGLEVMRDFAEEYANNPHSWYYYSSCLFDLGENKLATEAILTAHNLSQGMCDREIYRALCKILPATGKLNQTRIIITEMLSCFPESWSLWATAGRVLVENLKENERGCQYSLQATQLAPQLADTWFCHGRVLLLTDQHQAAVEAFTQGWQLLLPEANHLKSVSAAVWLGASYQALGLTHLGQAWLHIASQQAQELIEFDPIKARYWQDQALARLKNMELDI